LSELVNFHTTPLKLKKKIIPLCWHVDAKLENHPTMTWGEQLLKEDVEAHFRYQLFSLGFGQ
jgi:hypothetical protein